MFEFADIAVLICISLIGIAAFYDVTRMRIPNFVSGLLVTFFAVTAMLSPQIIEPIDEHVTVGFISLIVTFVLYSGHFVGGGDGKLFSSIALWAGPDYIWEFVLWTLVIGALIAFIGLLLSRVIPLLGIYNNKQEGWFASLQAGQPLVPFGLAISLGAIITLGKALL